MRKLVVSSLVATLLILLQPLYGQTGVNPFEWTVPGGGRGLEGVETNPLEAAGTQNYWTYAAKTKETLQDFDCPVTATLLSLGGQDVVLVVSEHSPCVPDGRTVPLFGKMTPSGSLKLSFPDDFPIVDIVKGHTGCTVVGPFPKYQGMLRDGVLHAETHFYSRCNEEWPDNDLFETPVDGPVHWKWTIDLEVVVP